jgi:hypothetical protein|tara:strand:- start:3620 stop:3757 length:138 start_codon:yes stop_codon:yes gene_type:complete
MPKTRYRTIKPWLPLVACAQEKLIHGSAFAQERPSPADQLVSLTH